MSETKTRDAKLVQLLNEAYGKERHFELSLESHMAMTTRNDYEKRLRQHLTETKSHASNVAKRIKQLGGTAETVSHARSRERDQGRAEPAGGRR